MKQQAVQPSPTTTQEASNSGSNFEQGQASLLGLGTASPAALLARIQRAPQTLTAHNVLHLQRAVGNRAVNALLNRNRSTSGEAADIQRHSESEFAPDRSGGGSIGGEVEQQIRASSGGSPLTPTVRRAIEPHLGRDLSQVRVHTGATSAQINRKIGAKAFTYGHNIFYGAGHSPRDIQLTAHEATHVVQQKNLARLPNDHQVQRSPLSAEERLPQARIQRAKDKISFNGYSKSIEKDNKDEFKSAITKMAMKGKKSVSAKGTPDAILLMGGSGSGKGSVLDQVVSSTKDFVHIDPDAVKTAMPAYQEGVKKGDKNIASTVHAESKDVANTVFQQALNSRRNLIYDGTGGNLGEYQAMANQLHGAGYRTKLVMTHVSVDEALVRVAAREQETGRGVPDSIVRDMYKWVPANFPKLVNDFDNAYLFDNMVAKGQAPKLIWEKSNGKVLNNDALTYLKSLLDRISTSKIDDSTSSASPDPKDADPTKSGMDTAKGRYFEEGGTRRWLDDAGSVKFGLNVSRHALSKIDQSLKLYRQYKAKNLSNAEEQANLLLAMQQAVAQSRYQSDEEKDSRTFKRRKAAVDLLSKEIDPELQRNPNRLMKVGSQSDKIKELVKTGFTTAFLGNILKRDLDLLYHAHAALAHQQLGLAQELMDKLNPVERDKKGAIKRDRYDYVERSRDNMHFAQQILTAYHHVNIGGDYARAFKSEGLDSTGSKKAENKYLLNKDFLGQGTLKEVTDLGKGKKDLSQLVSEYSNLTPQEIEAIRVYTAEKFKAMNATLQNVRVDDQYEGKDTKAWSRINALAASGVSKLPPFDGYYTYRGDSNFGGLTDTVQPGTVFLTPAFFSTSSNLWNTTYFGNGINWMILSGTKTRAKSMANIGTKGDGENEVLYPPGTRMKIIEVYIRAPNAVGATPVKEAWQPRGKSKMLPEVVEYLKTLLLTDRHTAIIVQETG